MCRKCYYNTNIFGKIFHTVSTRPTFCVNMSTHTLRFNHNFIHSIKRQVPYNSQNVHGNEWKWDLPSSNADSSECSMISDQMSMSFLDSTANKACGTNETKILLSTELIGNNSDLERNTVFVDYWSVIHLCHALIEQLWRSNAEVIWCEKGN